MLQSAWDEIIPFYSLPNVSPGVTAQFKDLHSLQSSHTKGEGNPRHYCSFFLPYDSVSGKIYLGHHKKADDWIPPGGHIEPDETPSMAAIREMKEELGVDIDRSMLSPFALSVKEIGRPTSGCMTHFDIWYLVNIKEQNFNYLKSEYYDASWFTLKDGLVKITKNPDFAAIIYAKINV